MTLTSSTLTSLRLRVLSFWNSSKRFSSVSHATASASMTKDFVPSLMHCIGQAAESVGQRTEDVVLHVLEKRTKERTHLWQLRDKLGVLDRHVFAVAREDADAAIFEVVDLRPLAVVFVLARELLALEAVEHFRDGFRRFRQHGLERNTCESGESRLVRNCYTPRASGGTKQRATHPASASTPP